MSNALRTGLGWPLGVWALGLLIGVAGSQLYANRQFEIAKPTENIRTAPEGRLIGTLQQGATIDEVGRDGRWVKFRLEAWVWGPSLEGFEQESIVPSLLPATKTADDPPARKPSEIRTREPLTALSVHLKEVRDLIDADYGRFYGLRLDPDLLQVQLRFRVDDIKPDALERRQMRAQHAVWALLKDDVKFETLQVETNRPDGGGEVGVRLAITSIEDIEAIGGEDLDAWRKATRTSSDGGATWSDTD